MPNIVKPSGINQLWAAGGTKVAPSLQKQNIGWVVELPPYQYQNWLDNRQDTFIAHINQHGIPEWDAETEYQGNLSYTQGSNGTIYKCLATNTNFNPVNPLNSTYWVIAFEVYGSVAVVQNALTVHLTNYATLSGITNPVAARNNLSVYSKAESDVRFAALAGSTSQTFSVANATTSTHAVPLGQLSSLLLAATESTAGQIAIATLGETETGTNDTKAITPLKANTVYLKKSGNLLGLANVATARSNLGLGDISTQSITAFLQAANNLSELTNAAVARNNLGLGSIAVHPVASFLQTGNNLGDVPNKPAARAVLGLTDLATTNSATVVFKADNLAGLASVATARNNLGLGTAATSNNEAFLWRGNNLGDLTNVQAARNNLQLGNLSTRNVYGVGGDLDFSTAPGQSGWMVHPSGVLECWGVINVTGQREGFVGYPRGFNGAAWNIQMTNVEQYPNEGNTVRVMDYTNPGGFSWAQNRADYTQYFWRALGGL